MEITDIKGGEIDEITEEHKQALRDKLERVFESGGYALLSVKTNVEGDNVTMDGSALVLGINPIRVVETVVATLGLAPEQIVVLFGRVAENLKNKK